MLMFSLITQLRIVLQQVDSYDQEIDTLVKTHPDSELFLAIPGIGPNLAARFLVMLGDDRQYYPSAAALQCEAGTTPVTKRSGKSRRVYFRRACNKMHRRTMHTFALQAIRFHPWSRDYYDRHRAKGRSSSEALRIVANAWVRIFYAVWRTRSAYNEQRFLNSQRERQSKRSAA